MKSSLEQSINLCDKPFGKRVVVYDFVGKYGDWLFKQPLLRSLREDGYSVHMSFANPFPSLISSSASSKNEGCNFALAFTRSDLRSLTKSFLKKNRYTVEIRREQRTIEAVILWDKSRRVLYRKFRKPHEQERIQSIAEFLGISYLERTIYIKPLQKKRVAVSFNVSENDAQRLRFSRNEIMCVLQYLYHNHYIIFYIKKKDKEDPILRMLPKDLTQNFKVVETKTMKVARRVIDGTTYYFGADSGLAHYAVQNGNIVLALFNKQYHGPTPLFNSNFFNHFVFFGNTKFSKEVIAYLRELQNPKSLHKETGKFIKEFIVNAKPFLKNIYANTQKLKWLKLYLVLQSTSYKKQLSQLENLMNGVFFSDNIYEFNYDELKQKKGAIFIDSRKFTNFLVESIHKNLVKSYKEVSIFAKNCSFFQGICLKRKVSDIDNLLISAHNFSGKRQQDILQLVQSALEKYSFSTQLPHQTPRIGSQENERQKYHPILLQGGSAFSLEIHDDMKDVEKYQTRIKVKIILGELSPEDLLSLREKIIAKQVSWGEHFLKEVDELLGEKKFFGLYEPFIRKIETLLSRLGGFGVNANAILTVNERDANSLSFILERLMRHGIIYINEDRLFINWDLRRPQHYWFVPITLVWNGKLPIEHIIKEALRGSIYAHPPFNFLKDLSRGKVTLQKMINLLSSESYLLIIEIFNALRGAKKQIQQSTPFSQKEIQDYVQFPHSNCNDKEDRKICLFGLLTGFSPKLSKQQIKLLSRYNLFVQYLNRPFEIPIHETRFFRRGSSRKTDSSKNFASEFKENFIRILREYYLYQKCNLPRFFLQEKRKELLFMYFVRGRGLLEGSLDQSQVIRKFLHSIVPNDFFGDSVLIRKTLCRFAQVIPGPSKNYILLRILKRL